MNMSRDQLRNRLLSDLRGKRQKRIVTLFGEQVEVRQATLKDVLSISAETDRLSATIKMLIDYVYVPGTEERVFEEGDMETLKQMPYNKDLNDLMEAFNKMSGIDTKSAEGNLEAAQNSA